MYDVVVFVTLDWTIPGVSSLVIHISDHGPWGLQHQPNNDSDNLTQIINILTAHSGQVQGSAVLV